MYLLAIIAGLTIGITIWFVASHWIATGINLVEDRRPALAGSKQLRVGEVVACGALFLVCAALALWIIRILLVQIR